MTTYQIEQAIRGRETTNAKELRATVVNGKTQMLPADPLAVAKILRERRSKWTPARRTRERIAADLKRRGLKA